MDTKDSRAAFLSCATVLGVLSAALCAAQELTVPRERLPTECALADSRSGYAGLRLPTNPWTGTDPSLIAEIRERVEGSPSLPDGPPMSPREAARFRLGLANGIEEAYAAVYQDAELKQLVPVYG